MLLPSIGDVEWGREALGRVQRNAVTPNAWADFARMAFDIDVRDVAPTIHVPTLVFHAAGDRVCHVENARFLARTIPGARYVEQPGSDHVPWAEDLDDFASEVREMLTGERSGGDPDRVLATVLFTDIVDSTRQSAAAGDRGWREILDSHDRITRSLVDEHGGRVVKSTGDGLLALFPMPSQGVECARAMLTQLDGIGLAIRAGLHAGELEVRDDGDISGLAVNLAARVEQAASDGELWVSSAVRDMTLGGVTTFSDRGEHQLKGIDGDWRLFSASLDAV